MMDLDAVRKRAVWAVHADGIFDIALGIPLLTMALGIVSDIEPLETVAIISYLLVMPLMVVLKAKVTRPRIGMVEVKPAVPKSIQVLILLGIMIFGVALLIFSKTTPDGKVSIVPFLLPVALPLGLAAYFFTIGRHYNLMRWKILSGALVAVAVSLPMINVTDDWKKGAALLLTGLFLLIGGLVTLANFVNVHPVGDKGEAA